MIPAIKRMLSRAPEVSEPAAQSKPEAQSAPRVHSLRDNYHLSQAQHAYCISLIDRIEHLYQSAPKYIESMGLDRALFFPGNEWTDIVPITGVKFRRAFDDIDYLRLMAPFAGFYLAFLDRLDRRLHEEPWDEELLSRMRQDGVSDDLVGLLQERVDPVIRLGACIDVGGGVSSCADEYARHIHNVPQKYRVRTPRMFGEIGLDIGGVLVNPDVVLCQSRINGMIAAGVFDKLDSDLERRGRIRVLEIGGGYGPLGQALKSIYKDRLEYVAVDLPSILYYPSIYLSTLANGVDCHVLLAGDAVPDRFNYLFVANYLLEEFGNQLGPVDLALNAMSFPEMSVDQVKYYAQFLRRVLRPDGVVFDENAAIKPHHTDSKEIFSTFFPFRKRVSSEVVMTKNWCQDVWSGCYVPEIFDCSDASLLK
jgi:hypothetical protein